MSWLAAEYVFIRTLFVIAGSSVVDDANPARPFRAPDVLCVNIFAIDACGYGAPLGPTQFVEADNASPDKYFNFESVLHFSVGCAVHDGIDRLNVSSDESTSVNVYNVKSV